MCLFKINKIMMTHRVETMIIIESSIKIKIPKIKINMRGRKNTPKIRIEIWPKTKTTIKKGKSNTEEALPTLINTTKYQMI